jgi:hypothetical protein
VNTNGKAHVRRTAMSRGTTDEEENLKKEIAGEYWIFVGLVSEKSIT